MTKKQTRNINICLFVALIAVLIVIQLFVESTSIVFTVLKKGMVYSLLAVSMNLLNGFTGLFSLGQAGFMLVGAYTYAILTIPVQFREDVYLYYDGGIVQFALPFLIAIVLAGAVAAVFAFLIGLPVLKLKSDYLAIATLGFAEIVRAIIQYNKFGPITNGSNLLRKFPSFNTLKFTLFGIEISFELLFPFIIVSFCILIIALLVKSTYGRAFKAIRDDEIAAEAMGINLAKHKRLSFIISSFFAGIGGALLAMFQATVQANTFKSAMTYEILLIVVIGGIGSITGSILSSFLYIACSEWWLRFLDNEAFIGTFQVPLLKSGFRMVVFSVIIMIVVLFFRQGIMGTKEFSVNGIINAFKKSKKAKGGNENE